MMVLDCGRRRKREAPIRSTEEEGKPEGGKERGRKKTRTYAGAQFQRREKRLGLFFKRGKERGGKGTLPSIHPFKTSLVGIFGGKDHGPRRNTARRQKRKKEKENKMP